MPRTWSCVDALMTKYRRDESPRLPAGAVPLLGSHVAPEPGHAGGRAAGRGPGDLGPHKHTASPKPHQHPPAAPWNLGASRESLRAAAGRSPGRRVGSAPPARRGRRERRSPPLGDVPWQVPGGRRAAGGGRLPGIWAGVGGRPCVAENLVSPPFGPGSSSSRRGARARRCLRAPRLCSRPPRTQPAPANASPSSSSSSSAHHRHYGRLRLLLLLAPPPLLALSFGCYQPIAPRSPGCCSLSVCLSLSLKFPISSRSGQREENTQFCLPFQVRSHTLVPTGTLAFPFTFASRAWLISPHSLSDGPWKPKRLRSPPPPQHV